MLIFKSKNFKLLNMFSTIKIEQERQEKEKGNEAGKGERL
jgi:hypothetical protein